MARRALALALLLAVAVAAPLHAQATEQAAAPPTAEAVSRWDRPWLIEGSVGFGTPVGLIGAQVERRFAPPVALRAGLGWNGYGMHASGMVRVRLPQAPALNLGAGLSGGPFHPICIDCDPPQPRWHVALFNNYELSAEARASGGFIFRIYLGYAWLMNTSAYHHDCPDCDEAPVIPQGVPYFGLAFGAAF